MSFLSPSEPATLHSLAPSTSLNPQQLQQPRSQGGLLAPDQPRPESDGDAYIRDATPYMAFLDNNSNSCSSPIVRSGANSATGIMSGMEINNSSPQAGFASVNASGPSMAPNSSAQANNNVLAQFVQMPGNDQLLFEFDELSQYLAFDATHDSLNDMGGEFHSLSLLGYRLAERKILTCMRFFVQTRVSMQQTQPLLILILLQRTRLSILRYTFHHQLIITINNFDNKSALPVRLARTTSQWLMWLTCTLNSTGNISLRTHMLILALRWPPGRVLGSVMKGVMVWVGAVSVPGRMHLCILRMPNSPRARLSRQRTRSCHLITHHLPLHLAFRCLSRQRQ